jgi:hypothetical protein
MAFIATPAATAGDRRASRPDGTAVSTAFGARGGWGRWRLFAPSQPSTPPFVATTRYRVSAPRRGRQARISTSTPSATVASALVPLSSMSVTRSDPSLRHVTVTREPTPRGGGAFGVGSRTPANGEKREPRRRGISPPGSRPWGRRPRGGHMPARWWAASGATTESRPSRGHRCELKRTLRSALMLVNSGTDHVAGAWMARYAVVAVRVLPGT